MMLVMGVMSTINSTFANEKDFSKLMNRDQNINILLASAYIPEKYKDKRNKKIRLPYGNSSELFMLGTNPGHGYDNMFTIELWNIPKSACLALGMVNLGNNHKSLHVNNFMETDTAVKDITSAKVANLCNKDTNTLYYTLSK